MTQFYTAILAFFCFTNTLAQISPEFVIQHYTEDNAIPQNSVKGIVRDEDGFIWLATEDGLVRYDGYKFRVFNKENLNTTSNRFRGFEVNRLDSNLYAKNSLGQLFLIKDGLATLTAPGKKMQDRQGATGDVEGASWQDRVSDTHQPLTDEKTINIFISKEESYKCSRNKVVFYSINKPQFEIPTLALNFSGFFTLGNELYYVDKTGIKIHFHHRKNTPFEFTGDILSDPSWKEGATRLRIWSNITSRKTALFMVGRQLYLGQKLSDGNIHTRLLLTDFEFEENQIVSLLYDETTDILWMGSRADGLFKIFLKRFKTINLPHATLNNPGYYYGQTRYSERTVLTAFGHLLGFDNQNRPFHSQATRLSNDQYVILTDSDGYIWVKDDYSLSKYSHNLSKVGQISVEGDITVLYEGPDGWIYVGSRQDGLVRIHKSATNGEVAHPLVKSLKNISFVQHESKDTLLVGTAKGLYRVALKDGAYKLVNGTQNLYIRSLLISNPGNQIWITTEGDGFYLLNKNALIKFPLDRGRYLASSHCVIEDQRGYFWITTNKGLFQVSKRDLLAFASGKVISIFYMFYNKDNGFEINEFNGGCQPCAVKLSDGMISIPSMKGMVFFEPNRWLPELPDKKVFIDRIDLDNVNIPLTSNLDLQHNYKQLRVYLTSPYYGNHRNLRFDYALIAKDKEKKWLPVGSYGIIFIPKYESGDYSLVIRKQNGFGVNNFLYKTIQISVAPVWYATWWCRSLVFILLCILVFYIVKLRTRSLVNKTMAQEILISQRTNSLQLALDQYKTSQKNLKKQMSLYQRLLTTISHDIKTPLHYLTFSNKNLLDRLEKEKQEQSLVLHSRRNYEGAEHLLNMTNNLLEFIKLWTSNETIDYHTVSLSAIIESKIKIFESAARIRKNVLLNQVSSELQINSHSDIISIIIHNLIDNAIKVTRDGKIIINQMVDDLNRLHIVVEDSGLGIRPEIMNWVNQKTERHIPGGSEEKPITSGIGLSMVKELAVLLNVEIRAELNETGGTSMHLIFPEHL